MYVLPGREQFSPTVFVLIIHAMAMKIGMNMSSFLNLYYRKIFQEKSFKVNFEAFLPQKGGLGQMPEELVCKGLL